MHPAFFIPTPSSPHRFIIRTRLPCKRHHPSLSVSYFCFHTRSLSLRHFPSTSSTHASDYLSNSHDSHSILFSSTPILDTHLRHVILTYLQSTSQARIFRPHLEPARYALRTTYRHIHKVISVIRPSREHRGIYTPYPTLGADLTKKGGEFSFASPIVLPQRYSLYVNVQKLMLYAALLM